jgi:hypothetical protein
MNTTIKTESGIYAEVNRVKYVNIVDLVPAEWDWFWDMLSSSNPDFSFGDNNLTLIVGERFARFIDDAYEWFSSEDGVETCTKDDWKSFVDTIWNMNKDQIYINLEA